MLFLSYVYFALIHHVLMQLEKWGPVTAVADPAEHHDQST
jgi:hypothetical protein